MPYIEKVVGVDLNPVARFVTRKEIELVGWEAMDETFKQLERTVTLNREPHLIHDGQELRFAHVFGRGLQQEDVGYFTAPFAPS